MLWCRRFSPCENSTSWLFLSLCVPSLLLVFDERKPMRRVGEIQQLQGAIGHSMQRKNFRALIQY